MSSFAYSGFLRRNNGFTTRMGRKLQTNVTLHGGKSPELKKGANLPEPIAFPGRNTKSGKQPVRDFPPPACRTRVRRPGCRHVRCGTPCPRHKVPHFHTSRGVGVHYRKIVVICWYAIFYGFYHPIPLNVWNYKGHPCCKSLVLGWICRFMPLSEEDLGIEAEPTGFYHRYAPP